MTSVNDIQHGGDHYKAAKTQHWDFIVDNGIGYLEGCASKYISRHTKKNGLEDVLKAEHYVQKILEKHLQGYYENTGLARSEDCRNFCEGAGMDQNSSDAFTCLLVWETEDDLLGTLDDISKLKTSYNK